MAVSHRVDVQGVDVQRSQPSEQRSWEHLASDVRCKAQVDRSFKITIRRKLCPRAMGNAQVMPIVLKTRVMCRHGADTAL